MLLCMYLTILVYEVLAYLLQCVFAYYCTSQAGVIH